MTPSQISDIYNKLQDLGLSKYAEQFYANPDAFDFSVLENNPNFTDNYSSVAEFTGDKYKLMQDLWNRFDGKKISQTRFETLKQKYPFLEKKELDEWFDKSNRYKEEYIKERETEAGKKRRELEVKNDWNALQHILASDYEKQRYINEPESAIFGKEAAGLAGSSAGAKADLAAGIAGGAADLVPKLPFVAVGPAIRAGRDVAHKVTDSPYQKDWSDIGKDFGTDAALGAGTMIFANARRAARAASTVAPENVRAAYELAADSKAINQGLKIAKGTDFNKLGNIDLYKKIQSLPESPMKNELLGASQDFMTKGIDRNAVEGIIKKYETYTDPEVIKAAKTVVNAGYKMPDAPAHLQKAITTEPVKGATNKVYYGLLRGADAVNTGAPGYMIFSGSRTAAGRGSAPNRVQTALESQAKRDQLDWYKANYARDWAMGFKPNAKEGDPLWEAYKEWKEGK